MSSPSGARPRPAERRGLGALLQTIDDLRRPPQRDAPAPVERGEVRFAVLELLAEEPMSGYQIVQALESRAEGVRAPGAAAVYPVLRLLVDEGLATAAETSGRRVYSLTERGRAAAAAAPERAREEPPWARDAPRESPWLRGAPRVGPIPRAALALAQAATLVARTGSMEQAAEAAAVLDEARRKLYSILARV